VSNIFYLLKIFDEVTTLLSVNFQRSSATLYPTKMVFVTCLVD